MTGNLFGIWDCPRCGENAALPTEMFLETFGDPRKRWFSSSDGIRVLVSGDGDTYPVRNGTQAWIPETDDIIDIWDEDDVEYAQRVVAQSGRKACCSWCYETYKITRFI